MALKVTNYLRNLGKSTKYMIGKTIEEDYGATYQAVDNAAFLAKETVNSLIHYKTTFKRVQNFVTKSPAFEAGALAYKNAKSSIRTGKFYDEGREMAGFEGMDDDSIDDDFDMDVPDVGGSSDDDGFDPEIDISRGDRAIAKSVSSSAKASTTALANTIVDSANMQVEAGKQTASFMLVHQERLFGNLNNSINNLGGLMGGMNGFLNGPMKSHLENSAKFFEESTKYQRENNAILKELIEMERIRFKDEEESRKRREKISGKKARTNISDIINADGSIDWTEYFQVMKKNFNNLKGNYGLDLIDGEALKMMAANPLEALPMMAVRKIMGKPLENALKGLNKTVGGIFAQVNADLKKSGEKGGLAELVADLLGVKVASKATRNSVKNNEYVKGQVPFDGITRKSIIEVIPGHLSRIEALLGGTAQHFDFDSGTWMTMKEIRKRRDDELASNKRTGLMDYKDELADTIKRMQVSKEDQKRLEAKIDAIADYAWNNNGSISGIHEDNMIFDGDAKQNINLKALLRAADRRGLAAEIAEATASQERKDLDRIKSGDSIFRLLNSKVDRNIREDGSANKALSEHSDENRKLFQAMVNELYLIRRSSTMASGGQYGVIGVPDYVDLSISGSRRTAQTHINNEVLAAAADNINKPQEATPDKEETTEEVYRTPEEEKKLEARRRKEENEKIKKVQNRIKNGDEDDPEVIREIQEAKGPKAKAKAFWHAIGDFWKDPRKLIANTIKTVDDSLYNFFFNHNTGEVDDEGNPINGFFEKVSHELVKTFDQAKEWMQKKVFDPMKEYLSDAWEVGKEFMDGLSGGWFSKFIDEFKSEGKDTIDKGRDSINNALGRNSEAKVKSLEDEIKEYEAEINRLTDELKTTVNDLEAINKITDAHNKMMEKMSFTEGEKKALLDVSKSHYGKIRRDIFNFNGAQLKFDGDEGPLTQFINERAANTTSNLNLVDEFKHRKAALPGSENFLDRADLSKLGSNYGGSLLVPDYGLTTISKGEMIIPADLNPFNPDRNKSNRNKDRRKEEQIKNDLFRDIMSHADGGNALDGVNFKDLAEQAKGAAKGAYDKNGVPGIVGAVVNKAVQEILPDSLKGQSAKELGSKAHDKISATMDTALDKLEGYSKTLDPEIQSSLKKDIDRLRENSAGMAAGAAVKGGIGAVVGTALMGPGLGTLLGSMGGIALQSETVKTFLLGNELQDGSRAGGLISRKYQAMAKKYLPDMGKWGLAGGAIGLFTGFGPLGGAVIGSAASLAKNSEKVNEFVFGKKILDEDGKVVDRVGGILGKKNMARLKKSLPHAAVASLGTFMMTGAGLLPSLAIGTGIGLVTSTDTFKDLLFGKKGEDGKRHGGLVGLMKKHVVNPLANFAREIRYDFMGFMYKHMLKPMTLAAKTFGATFKGLSKHIGNKMLDTIEKIYAGPLSKLLGRGAKQWILNPIGKILGGTASFVKGFAKNTIGLPFVLGGKMLTGMAKSTQKFNIRHGIATDLTAGERLDIMKDKDYKTKEFDRMIANSDEESLEQLKSHLRVARSQKSISGTDYDGALRKSRKRIDPLIQDQGIQKKLNKLLHEGNEEKVLKYISGLKVDHSTKNKLLKVVQEELKNIKDAKGLTEYTDEQKAAANKFLADKGINLDITDRSQLTRYIDLLDTEIDAKKTNRELTDGKFKYTTEAAANVAEGMNETNSILSEILKAITGAKEVGFAGSVEEREARNKNIDNVLGKGRDALNAETIDTHNAFFNNLGIDNHTSNDTDAMGRMTGKSKSAKQYQKAFKGFKGLDFSGAALDVDSMMKFKPKDIKRFAQLAKRISMKEFNKLDLNNIAKLTDRQFKQILDLASIKGLDGTPFRFKGDLNKYTNMNPDKIKYLHELVAAGLTPVMSKKALDTMYDKRGILAAGMISKEDFFAETILSDDTDKLEAYRSNKNQLNAKELEQKTIEENMHGAKERLTAAQAEVEIAMAKSEDENTSKEQIQQEIAEAMKKVDAAQAELNSAEGKLNDTKKNIDSLKASNKEILNSITGITDTVKQGQKDRDHDGKSDTVSTDGSFIHNDKDAVEKSKKEKEEAEEKKGFFSRMKDWFTGGKKKKDGEGKEEKKEGGFFSGIFGDLFDSAKSMLKNGLLIFAGLKLFQAFGEPLINNVIVPGMAKIGEFLKEKLPAIVDTVVQVTTTIIKDVAIPVLMETAKQLPGIVASLLDPRRDDGNGGTEVTAGSLTTSALTAGALGWGGYKFVKGGKSIYDKLLGKGGKPIQEAVTKPGMLRQGAGWLSKHMPKSGKLGKIGAGLGAFALAGGASELTKGAEVAANTAKNTNAMTEMIKGAGKGTTALEEAMIAAKVNPDSYKAAQNYDNESAKKGFGALSAAETAAKAGQVANPSMWGKAKNFLKNNKMGVGIAGASFIAELYSGKSVTDAAIKTGDDMLQGERQWNAGTAVYNKAKSVFSATETAASAGSKAAEMTEGTKMLSKIGETGSKVMDSSGKASKTLEFIKGVLTSGLEKVKNLVPFLKNNPNGVGTIVSRICGSIASKPNVLTKFVAKFASKLAIAATGIGGVVLTALTVVDVAYHVYQGYNKWYNVADVLPDATVEDEVKWLCGLAEGVDALLLGLLGPQTYADIIFYLAQIDLSKEKARAQEAITRYNAMEKKPDGLPERVETVEDYNEKVFSKLNTDTRSQESLAKINKERMEKGGDGDIKSVYNQADINKPWYSKAADTITTMGKNAIDSNFLLMPASALSKFVSGKSLGEHFEDGAKWVRSKLGMGKDGETEDGRTEKELSQQSSPAYGMGKDGFFKQTDPAYANTAFNIPGDTIKQTIGDSGCGPVAGVNALKALGRSKDPNPVEASEFAISNGFKGNDTGIHPDFFKSYGAAHGAKVVDTDKAGTIANLQAGNPVVLQGESATGTSSDHPFGKYPHYVTATDYDQSTGQVTIQDPEEKAKDIKYDLNKVLKNTTSASSFIKSRDKVLKKYGYGHGNDKKYGLGTKLYGRGTADRQKIWTLIQSAGYKDICVAGIMGNMYAESRFDTTAVNPDSGAYGLCQWLGPRKSALMSHCSSKGLDYTSVEGQISYLLYEMATTEAAMVADNGADKPRFLGSSTPEAAAENFLDWFERGSQKEKEQSLGLRQQTAKSLYDAYKTGKNVNDAKLGDGVAGGSSGGKSKPKGIFGEIIESFQNQLKPVTDTVSDLFKNSEMGKSMKNIADMLGLSADTETGSDGKNGGMAGDVSANSVGDYVFKQATNQANGGDPAGQLGSEFGEQRIGYTHNGQDMGVDPGSPVVSPVDAKAFADSQGGEGYGDYVGLFDSKNNTSYVFGHLSKQEVSTGDMVKKGQIIGRSGNTGHSTGPHIHFGVATNSNETNAARGIGNFVDPMKFPMPMGKGKYGTGKHGTSFGRGTVPTRASDMMKNYEDSLKPVNSNYSTRPTNAKPNYGRGGSSLESVQTGGTNAYAEEVLRVLYAIDAKLAGINSNTSGITNLQEDNKKTNKKIDDVHKSMSSNLTNVSSSLLQQLGGVANGLKSIIDTSTSSMANETVSQLQYLAAK